MLDAATSVPIPGPAYVEPQPRRRWAWALAGSIVLLVTLAAIRGDAPRTVLVAEGSISPLPAAEETAIPPDAGAMPYIEIDPTAGENLEVCDWDYCVVHDEIGLQRISEFLYQISLSEARTIADDVVDDWGVSPVSVTSTVIPGELGGFYDPNRGSITLDEPLIAWSLIHELAHHIVTELHSPGVDGHGPEFLGTLESLAGGP